MAFDLGWIRFYGDWKLRVGTIYDLNGYLSSFTIRGSANGDGTYYPRSEDPPLELEVTGDQWEIQFARIYGIPGFHVALAQRTTSFDGKDGMRVDLDTRAPATGGSGTLPGMQLGCTLDDPDIRVPDPGDPFDFTVPELPRPLGLLADPQAVSGTASQAKLRR
jgi:hypothetical protein